MLQPYVYVLGVHMHMGVSLPGKGPILAQAFLCNSCQKELCSVSYPALQAMVRTLICLPFPISVQAWVPCPLHRQPKPLRSALLQQMRVCMGREREERAARPGSHHTQAGCSEPLPGSWDHLGQNSKVCGAKVRGSSLGWKYSVNITIQCCWASGLLGKCQWHCTAQCTKSLSGSIGNISGALAVLMLKKQGKLGQVDLQLEWVSKPVQALLNYAMLCYMVISMFCCLVEDAASC